MLRVPAGVLQLSGDVGVDFCLGCQSFSFPLLLAYQSRNIKRKKMGLYILSSLNCTLCMVLCAIFQVLFYILKKINFKE